MKFPIPEKIRRPTAKFLCSHLTCTEFVQRGVSLVLASSFDLRAWLFHMVFNRTVENFYKPFTIRDLSEQKVAGELLERENIFLCAWRAIAKQFPSFGVIPFLPVSR